MNTQKFIRIILIFTIIFHLILIPIKAKQLSIIDLSSEIEINEINFPDKNFNTYVLSLDTDKNGYLSTKEILSVKSINVENHAISDLSGISYFINLLKVT